jgi:chromosome partitioning protein
LQWASQGTTPFPVPVKQIQGKWDAEGLRQSFRAFRHVVLDCPPSLESHASIQALRACDLALIPVLPSPVDLWASLRLPQEIDEARRLRPQLKAYLVLNQMEPQSAFSAAMTEALADFGLPVLKSRIRRRAAFRNAALDGVSVYQMGGRGSPAMADIEAIIKEVLTK